MRRNVYRSGVFLLISLLAVSGAFAQVVDSFENAFYQQYEQNIRKERLNGVYIPKDMADAFIELERLSDPGAVTRFKAAPEDVISHKLHFGLGKWMIVNWNFYDGSRFSHVLRQMGVTHPDDMAQFTIVSWHRHLNGIPLQMEERAKAFKESRSMLAGKPDSLKKDSMVLPKVPNR